MAPKPVDFSQTLYDLKSLPFFHWPQSILTWATQSTSTALFQFRWRCAHEGNLILPLVSFAWSSDGICELDTFQIR